jgi:hypothetical protein
MKIISAKSSQLQLDERVGSDVGRMICTRSKSFLPMLKRLLKLHASNSSNQSKILLNLIKNYALDALMSYASALTAVDRLTTLESSELFASLLECWPTLLMEFVMPRLASKENFGDIPIKVESYLSTMLSVVNNGLDLQSVSPDPTESAGGILLGQESS